MTIGQSLLGEFDQEMKVTRRVLERVPSDKGEWKPHAKSFALGHLAQLISWMPGWIGNAASTDGIDLSSAPKYTYEKTTTLLDGFDANVKEAREALSKVSDADLQLDWSLRNGPQVFFTQKRGEVIRNTISHLVHHRGQMTVYLRLLDVAVPSIYGPSADERTF